MVRLDPRHLLMPPGTVERNVCMYTCDYVNEIEAMVRPNDHATRAAQRLVNLRVTTKNKSEATTATTAAAVAAKDLYGEVKARVDHIQRCVQSRNGVHAQSSPSHEQEAEAALQRQTVGRAGRHARSGDADLCDAGERRQNDGDQGVGRRLGAATARILFAALAVLQLRVQRSFGACHRVRHDGALPRRRSVAARAGQRVDDPRRR